MSNQMLIIWLTDWYWTSLSSEWYKSIHDQTLIWLIASDIKRKKSSIKKTQEAILLREKSACKNYLNRYLDIRNTCKWQIKNIFVQYYIYIILEKSRLNAWRKKKISTIVSRYILATFLNNITLVNKLLEHSNTRSGFGMELIPKRRNM